MKIFLFGKVPFATLFAVLISALSAVQAPAASETSAAFPLSIHKKIRDRALARALAELDIEISSETLRSWRKRLNRSNFYQDIFRFFWARYHFDNCNFSQGIKQVQKFQREIERDYEKLRTAPTRKHRDKYRGRIIFKTGRIIHALHDFFSHSNFVELNTAKFDSIIDVPLVDIWSRKGQQEFLGWVNDGLESHYFLLSFPKRCAKKPRSPLAKDPGRSRAGRFPTKWKRQDGGIFTSFEAAEYLSEVATTHIFKEIFKTYPMMFEKQNDKK
ncbi:MAG: hypothetical protein KF881_01220 [Acidobacteria bacterium]|nr:hypothetical protein [Acidobacteriota bacterium]